MPDARLADARLIVLEVPDTRLADAALGMRYQIPDTQMPDLSCRSNRWQTSISQTHHGRIPEAGSGEACRDKLRCQICTYI